jgi:hypothetical protein
LESYILIPQSHTQGGNLPFNSLRQNLVHLLQFIKIVEIHPKKVITSGERTILSDLSLRPKAIHSPQQRTADYYSMDVLRQRYAVLEPHWEHGTTQVVGSVKWPFKMRWNRPVES